MLRGRLHVLVERHRGSRARGLAGRRWQRARHAVRLPEGGCQGALVRESGETEATPDRVWAPVAIERSGRECSVVCVCVIGRGNGQGRRAEEAEGGR